MELRMTDFERVRQDPPAMAEDGGIDWQEYAERLAAAIDAHLKEDAEIREQGTSMVAALTDELTELREAVRAFFENEDNNTYDRLRQLIEEKP